MEKTAKSEAKVWAVKTEWASEDSIDASSGSDVTLYATEALAREAFNKEVAEEIIRCTEKGYKIEPTENSFEAYEEGYYAANHSLISLEQLTINT